MLLSSSFLIIDLYFLISAVIVEILNSIIEFAIPTKGIKGETKTDPVSKKAKISKCSI